MTARAVWAIGDLQGCADALDRLLRQIVFDPRQDSLLFTGDLINRGPSSLLTLRKVKALGNAAQTVLGNHDLHLLAAAAGVRPPRKEDTLDEILAAPDRDELIDWLRSRPLAIRFEHGARAHLLVHAGVLPQWDAAQTLALAAEVESALRANDWAERLRDMYGNEPAAWRDDLRGADRMRIIINAFTRVRFVDTQGRMDFELKESASVAPAGLIPWFDHPGRRTRDHVIIFGHWSTLGLKLAPRLLGIDTGCVWGGKLTAVRLSDRLVAQTACTQARKPGKR